MRAAEGGFPALRDFAGNLHYNLHYKALCPVERGAVVKKGGKNETFPVLRMARDTN